MEENVALPAGFTMSEMPSVIGTFGSKVTACTFSLVIRPADARV